MNEIRRSFLKNIACLLVSRFYQIVKWDKTTSPNAKGSSTSEQKKALVSGSILFIFLLTAGCISSPGTMNQTVNATPSQNNCPPLHSNVTPYIFINHINNFTLGDMVEISGTTNSRGPLLLRSLIIWDGGPDLALGMHRILQFLFFLK